MTELTCLSCRYSYRDASMALRCSFHKSGAVRKCSFFRYEPGTSPAEYESHEEYMMRSK